MTLLHPTSDALRPASLTQALREIGPQWHLDIRGWAERTRAIYEPLLAAAPPAALEVVRDQPYGSHPRQVLDIYRPPGARGRPVVAFVHGGAFVRGEKNTSDHLYANVLTWFVRQGCVGVNIEYRLADEAPYPGASHDVAQACDWIAEHIDAHGGDASRICLIGHSAGGTHAATCLSDPVMDRGTVPVAALVLISARLRADVLPANPNAAGVRAYYGLDERLYESRSAIAHAARLQVPTLLVNAEFENPLLDRYGLEYALALTQARGRAPVHLTLPDHNHMSIVTHFNTSEDTLGRCILEFIDGHMGCLRC
jgi:acetyl esterase/lipase